MHRHVQRLPRRRVGDLDEVSASYQRVLTEQREPLAQVKAGAVSPSDALIARTRVFDAWRAQPPIDSSPATPGETAPN